MIPKSYAISLLGYFEYLIVFTNVGTTSTTTSLCIIWMIMQKGITSSPPVQTIRIGSDDLCGTFSASRFHD